MSGDTIYHLTEMTLYRDTPLLTYFKQYMYLHTTELASQYNSLVQALTLPSTANSPYWTIQTYLTELPAFAWVTLPPILWRIAHIYIPRTRWHVSYAMTYYTHIHTSYSVTCLLHHSSIICLMVLGLRCTALPPPPTPPPALQYG